MSRRSNNCDLCHYQLVSGVLSCTDCQDALKKYRAEILKDEDGEVLFPVPQAQHRQIWWEPPAWTWEESPIDMAAFVVLRCRLGERRRLKERKFRANAKFLCKGKSTYINDDPLAQRAFDKKYNPHLYGRNCFLRTSQSFMQIQVGKIP